MATPNELIDVMSSLEQFETTLESFAPLIVTYYKSMVDLGLPEHLAQTLTIEWHGIYWTQMWERTVPPNE